MTLPLKLGMSLSALKLFPNSHSNMFAIEKE